MKIERNERTNQRTNKQTNNRKKRVSTEFSKMKREKTVTQLIHSILLYIFGSLFGSTVSSKTATATSKRGGGGACGTTKEWLKYFSLFDVKECDGNVCGFTSLLLLLWACARSFFFPHRFKIENARAQCLHFALCIFFLLSSLKSIPHLCILSERFRCETMYKMTQHIHSALNYTELYGVWDNI